MITVSILLCICQKLGHFALSDYLPSVNECLLGILPFVIHFPHFGLLVSSWSEDPYWPHKACNGSSWECSGIFRKALASIYCHLHLCIPTPLFQPCMKWVPSLVYLSVAWNQEKQDLFVGYGTDTVLIEIVLTPERTLFKSWPDLSKFSYTEIIFRS